MNGMGLFFDKKSNFLNFKNFLAKKNLIFEIRNFLGFQKFSIIFQTCDLEWMCPNCAPKTMENWFFRETIGKLHF